MQVLANGLRVEEVFDGSRLKIKRAEDHLNELDREVKGFFARGAVKVIFEQAHEYDGIPGGICAYTYREFEPVPPMWSAIVGDILHNLRVSLDLLVSDLHRMSGGKPSDAAHVYYPFCRIKADLPETIRKRRLSGLRSEYLRLIESTAPYKGGNDGLRAIHDLDIQDKHKALVPVIAVVSLPWPVPIIEGPPKFTTTVAKDGQRLMAMPPSICPLPIGSEMKAEFSMLFASGGPFAGCKLIEQLTACGSSVSRIVDLFAEVASG